MRVANPRPLSRRETQGPTRDEVQVGPPVVVGGPRPPVPEGPSRTWAAPLFQGPHRPGMNDSPTAIRAREDR